MSRLGGGLLTPVGLDQLIDLAGGGDHAIEIPHFQVGAVRREQRHVEAVLQGLFRNGFPGELADCAMCDHSIAKRLNVGIELAYAQASGFFLSEHLELE